MQEARFTIKWDDFQTNVSKSYELLRGEKDFFDVTLVSEDETPVEAHKVVLSACSPMLKQLLRQTQHPHPLLYLGGVSSAELDLVMDYIYRGEVQIYQNRLDRFLEVAQRFRLGGLERRSKPAEQTRQQHKLEKVQPEEMEERLVEETEKYEENHQTESNSSPAEEDESRRSIRRRNRQIGVPVVVDVTGMESFEVERSINELIVRNDEGKWSCKACGKAGFKTTLREHVEMHVNGLSYPCDLCDKIMGTKGSLRNHKKVSHGTTKENDDAKSDVMDEIVNPIIV